MSTVLVPRCVREWWGPQGAIRKSRVGPTTFYEVGYRRRGPGSAGRGGGFCLMGRSHDLGLAIEKARRRVEALSPQRAAVLEKAVVPVNGFAFSVSEHAVFQMRKRAPFALEEDEAMALIVSLVRRGT